MLGKLFSSLEHFFSSLSGLFFKIEVKFHKISSLSKIHAAKKFDDLTLRACEKLLLKMPKIRRLFCLGGKKRFKILGTSITRLKNKNLAHFNFATINFIRSLLIEFTLNIIIIISHSCLRFEVHSLENRHPKVSLHFSKLFYTPQHLLLSSVITLIIFNITLIFSEEIYVWFS